MEEREESLPGDEGGIDAGFFDVFSDHLVDHAGVWEISK